MAFFKIVFDRVELGSMTKPCHICCDTLRDFDIAQFDHDTYN
jgi:hypothetical protein